MASRTDLIDYAISLEARVESLVEELRTARAEKTQLSRWYADEIALSSKPTQQTGFREALEFYGYKGNYQRTISDNAMGRQIEGYSLVEIDEGGRARAALAEPASPGETKP